jgi:hypothetical protein
MLQGANVKLSDSQLSVSRTYTALAINISKRVVFVDA